MCEIYMRKSNLVEIERKITYGDRFSLKTAQYQKRTDLAFFKKEKIIQRKNYHW